jgi:hypothetical protein
MLNRHVSKIDIAVIVRVIDAQPKIGGGYLKVGVVSGYYTERTN